jgi:hypothetical protein
MYFLFIGLEPKRIYEISYVGAPSVVPPKGRSLCVILFNEVKLTFLVRKTRRI